MQTWVYWTHYQLWIVNILNKSKYQPVIWLRLHELLSSSKDIQLDHFYLRWLQLKSKVPWMLHMTKSWQNWHFQHRLHSSEFLLNPWPRQENLQNSNRANITCWVVVKISDQQTSYYFTLRKLNETAMNYITEDLTLEAITFLPKIFQTSQWRLHRTSACLNSLFNMPYCKNYHYVY